MAFKILSVVAELRALPRADQEWLLAELQQIADDRLRTLMGAKAILGTDVSLLDRRIRAIEIGKKLIAAAWDTML